VIPVSSFSIAARQLKQLLGKNISDIETDAITISNPKKLSDPPEHSINLFFYQIDYSGFPADVSSMNPFYVRIHCLISAFGISDTIGHGQNSETISAAENDLRLVGEVMRVLHQNPVINFNDNGNALHLQVVFLPLALDDLNHLWATLGNNDTAYRLSVAYELALAPVPLAAPVEASPRVGSIGFSVENNMQQPPMPEQGFALKAHAPEVKKTIIDVGRSHWSPQIAFLVENVVLRYVLHLPDTGGVRQFEILLAGNQGEELQFEWELWQWDYSTNEGGWGEAIADERTPLTSIPLDDVEDNPLRFNIIDPDNIDSRLINTVQFPVTAVASEDVRYQAMLYAVREVTRQRLQKSDEIIRLRSNPLLISLYVEEATA